jgi:HEXXH motif-containing protein
MSFDLVESVNAALKHLGDRAWMPELTEELAKAGWRDLYRDSELTPSSYGTARVIARTESAPHRIVGRPRVALGADVPDCIFQVEILDKDFSCSYEEAGVRFYTAEEIEDARILEQLEEAISILKLLPSLGKSVATLVKTVHLIDSGDDDYDISFSKPHIPFSVFVSLPRKRNPITNLRAAEAIVHEAMHLQLTLIERIVPLVESTGRQYYSPWRGELRNTLGVLHGLYVFRVIDEFLRELKMLDLFETEVDRYIDSRVSEIHHQVSSIKTLPSSEDLTEIGSEFTWRLIAGFDRNHYLQSF